MDQFTYLLHNITAEYHDEFSGDVRDTDPGAFKGD